MRSSPRALLKDGEAHWQVLLRHLIHFSSRYNSNHNHLPSHPQRLMLPLYSKDSRNMLLFLFHRAMHALRANTHINNNNKKNSTCSKLKGIDKSLQI